MNEISYVYEVDELKQQVPIDVVASELGIAFGADGRTFCPFHDDRNTPNLEHMGAGDDGTEWAYCRACGTSTDIISLVQQVRGVQFYEALIWLSSLADELPEDVRPAPPRQRADLVPDDSWEARLDLSQDRAREHLDIGLLSYAYGFTDESTPSEERESWDRHLLDWGWGLDEAANVLIPHRDVGGNLTAVKKRLRDGRWRAYGPLSQLYGAWKLKQGATHAVLCEGESDAVWADRQCDGRMQVFALPAGANSFDPCWVEFFGPYNRVYIAFDADEAGRRATARWVEELGSHRTSVLPIHDGEDLRSNGEPLVDLIERTWRSGG